MYRYIVQSQQVSDDNNNDEETQPDYFQGEIEPTSPTNSGVNYFDHDYVTILCDTILQGDETAGWRRPIPDSLESKRLEDFFNLMFDDLMFEPIADRTNEYARNNILKVTLGRD